MSLFLFQKTKTKLYMITLEEFKKQIGKTALSDKQLEELKNSLYAFIGSILIELKLE